MANRFVSIWFPHLLTDWFTLMDISLRHCPLVISTPSNGKMIVIAANALAQTQGISSGMSLADARAFIPTLQVRDHQPELAGRLLKKLAAWSIRYTPIVGIDPPDSLLFDATGCSHLWNGEKQYLNAITQKLNARGYDIRLAMADTIGAAWAAARFGKNASVISPGKQFDEILNFPPSALRLEPELCDLMSRLGLRQLRDFAAIPLSSLRNRFGNIFLQRLKQAMGQEEEFIQPVIPPVDYQERLPSPEPIITATAIKIALQRLLDSLCSRLRLEQKGLRHAALTCFRVDGNNQTVEIGTNGPSHHATHLYRLFENKLESIEPGLGIELFTLNAKHIEEHKALQEKIWEGTNGLEDHRLTELADRITNRIGQGMIHRYLPGEHHWPERSYRKAAPFTERSTSEWRTGLSRPIKLLPQPEPIEVAVPVPDYPPMLFRYKGILHTIKKADGPERIEREWWIDEGTHRDYYSLEDQDGRRYWVFRAGHYSAGKKGQWFLCGFFA